MKLLFIGEEQQVFERVTTILRDEGYSVDAADTASFGRFRWLNGDYNLIVLDISSEISERWADDPALRQRNSGTPVLMLKSRDRELDKTVSNTHDVILKPFARSELIGRVRARLRQPVMIDKKSIEIGSVVIDRILQTVTVDHNRVALTNKEYCLLEFLAVHRGTPVSRTEIYDHLFDIVDPATSNLLDVYVCKIRRKLGDRLITTHRGLGYVIDG